MAPGPDLDAAQLLETAATRTGLSDFGPPTFREGLDRIVEGIRTESQLNPMGQGGGARGAAVVSGRTVASSSTGSTATPRSPRRPSSRRW